MPIERHESGATMITGEGIPLFQLLSLRSAIKLENKGLKRRGPSATSIAMSQFGIPGKATKKNREKVLNKLEVAISQQKSKVRMETEPETPADN